MSNQATHSVSIQPNEYRTHHCGQLNATNIHSEVVLSGWVNKIRDKGYIIWVELRDFYGITQLVFDQQRTNQPTFEKVKHLSREDVIQIKGQVIHREAANPNIPTGNIEVLVEQLQCLSHAQTPPFTIEDQTDGGLELRMKYRYLDIRRQPIRDNLIFRHQLVQSIRNYLSHRHFFEIETPFLIKSTPEGARDFMVSSHINKGQYYALPQSPQTLKQLLMVGGFDKYFQIVKCFRDEDLRSDRQPEFTQLDCELSFVNKNNVMAIFEGLLSHLLQQFTSYQSKPFKQLSFEQAINTYGTDKPDLRFEMKLVDLTQLVQGKGFQLFDTPKAIIGMVIENGGDTSRKTMDQWTKWMKSPQIGANGLIWVSQNQDGNFRSSISKFYNANDFSQWFEKANADKGDLLLLVWGDRIQALSQMGTLRNHLAQELDIINPELFVPLWVTDFPLFEWDEQIKRYRSMHHPFTAPLTKDIPLLEHQPLKVRAQSYDLVLNGKEIGGGSIRISESHLQLKVLEILGFSKSQANDRFGFLLEALTYGAPPHGGIAWGIDRLAAVLKGKESIKDFIAFPKNNQARDLMMGAPTAWSQDQLQELE
ncbi:MAG: aspartate--tRNA ligase [Flavobacteriaceae bacterium]|nr:aspartate--tRNA ligase [Flavobacteriaceae bacterium]